MPGVNRWRPASGSGVDPWQGLVQLLLGKPVGDMCPICRRKTTGSGRLCAACATILAEFPRLWCRRCGRPATGLDALGQCADCRCSPPAFLWARSLGLYQGLLRRAIVGLKYRGSREVALPLGRALALLARAASADDLPDLVVPVPQSPEGRARRRYNQATLLAGHTAATLGRPVADDWLRRVRHGPSQVGLSPGQRRANVFRAFRAGCRQESGKVLLVDDVLTTGATASACAAALLAGGAQAVVVVTCAAPPARQRPSHTRYPGGR